MNDTAPDEAPDNRSGKDDVERDALAARAHRHLLKHADIEALPGREHVHQFNSNAVRITRTLSAPTGLQHLGMHLVRLPPGRDSTTYHYHDGEEEFLYVLSGRGIAEIGATTQEIGPGDFMGFPRGSAAHLLSNPFDSDLVYLMGGEHRDLDVVHYPRIGRSMIKHAGRKLWADHNDIHEVPP